MKNCSVIRIRFINFLLITGVFAPCKFVMGQYWKTAGNSPSPTSSVYTLGTKNCNEIDFKVNNEVRIKFTSDCMSTYNEIEFLNNERINFGSTESVVLPGGGTIYTKGSGTALLPSPLSTAMKIGLTDSVPDTEATFQLFDSPASLKSLIHAETKSTGTTNCYSIFAKAYPKGGYGYGVSSEGGRYGIYAKASGSAFANGTVVVSGIYGKATGTAGIRAGVYAEAAGTLTSTNYGIYATASSVNGGAAGYFSGDITYTGALFQGSDRKLKRDIRDCKNALEMINKLSVKEYYYDEKYSFMNFPVTKQFGFIAQEVEESLPELVAEKYHPGKSDEITGEEIYGPVTYKSINYTGLIPLAIAAIREQEEKIVRLEEINDQLQKRLTELEKIVFSEKEPQTYSGQASATVKNVHLNYLLPNTPNPAWRETELPYYIDSDFTSAEIRILSTSGSRLLQSIPVVSKGNSRVHLDCSMLSPGIYTYELMIDGTKADSRNLIIAQ